MSSSRPRTGLVLPGVTVALTPARAFTSRLRRRFHERYRGRYRFPALLFAIDGLVAAFVLTIFGVGIWLSVWQPQEQAGMRLVFSAPPLMTATTIAFEAKISSQDGRMHPDVRLRWVLPVGTEVVSASPSVDTRHEVLIGDLLPGEEVHARIAVRLFLPPGSARIGFQLRSGNELLSGEELRSIVGSALKLEPVISPRRSSAGRNIFSLKNSGNASLDCAQIQTSGDIYARFDAQTIYHYPFPGGSRAVFDAIGPGEERFIPATSPNEMKLLCKGVELQYIPPSDAWPTSWRDPMAATLSASTPGQPTVLTVTSTESLRVLVYHPLLQEAEQGRRWFDVPSGTTSITLPLDFGREVVSLTDRIPRWFVWLTRSTPEGIDLLQVHEGIITTPLLLQTEARYYAASGGQIGAGPLPPRIGQATRYWVQWKIPTTKTDLSQVEVRAVLPTGVSFTGQKALPNGGEFVEDGNQLIWSLPFLAATNEGASVAFEVSLTPTEAMRDRVPLLMEVPQVRAFENRSETMIEFKAQAVDTSLPTDEKGKNQGWVK